MLGSCRFLQNKVSVQQFRSTSVHQMNFSLCFFYMNHLYFCLFSFILSPWLSPCVPCTNGSPLPHEMLPSTSSQVMTSRNWTTLLTTGWAQSPERPCRPTVTPSCSSPSSALVPPNSWLRILVPFSGLLSASCVFCCCFAKYLFLALYRLPE